MMALPLHYTRDTSADPPSSAPEIKEQITNSSNILKCLQALWNVTGPREAGGYIAVIMHQWRDML